MDITLSPQTIMSLGGGLSLNGVLQRVGNPLPSSHSEGMQQNWLVGLTVAPMKLATSGQGSPRNPHDHWWLVGFGRYSQNEGGVCSLTLSSHSSSLMGEMDSDESTLQSSSSTGINHSQSPSTA